MKGKQHEMLTDNCTTHLTRLCQSTMTAWHETHSVCAQQVLECSLLRSMHENRCNFVFQFSHVLLHIDAYSAYWTVLVFLSMFGCKQVQCQ